MVNTATARTATTASATGLGSDALLLLARLALAAVFALSGWGKVTNPEAFAGMLTNRFGLPGAYPLALLAAAVEFLGGIALILGLKVRWAALALVFFTGIATYLAHRYWTFPAEQVMNQYNHFMKNVAIIGGLLAVIATGAGRWSVDGILYRSA